MNKIRILYRVLDVFSDTLLIINRSFTS